MIAGIVPLRNSFKLRVAAAVLGVDIEFGPTATRAAFQRIDVLSSEALAGPLLAKYGVVVGKANPKKRFQESDGSLLARPKLVSSKQID